jgi:heptosyltransferase-2
VTGAVSVTGSAAQLLPGNRILVVRYRFIGDTILTVPFLRNLRRAYPHATIDVLVGPQSGSVLEGCPYINELIVFDTTRFHKYDSGPGRTGHFFQYAVQLRRRQYDLVFLLKRSLSSALLAWLTGARYRIGHNTEGRRIFLTHAVPWDASRHEVESTLDVLRASHVPIVDDYLESWVSQSEQADIAARVPELERAGTRMLIHAAAAHAAKMYPLKGWAEVVKVLQARLNATCYFTGAAQDTALYDELEALAGVKGVNLAGKLSIRESLALYHRMDLAVCVDSGPAHMAAAAGVPTVAIFGPTDPGRWRPWGEEHAAVCDASLKACPCVINHTCSERPCLTSLDASVIIETALKTFWSAGQMPRSARERLEAR